MYAFDQPSKYIDPTGREPITICSVLALIYRTASTTWFVGNGLIACYSLRHCRKCLAKCDEYSKWAREHMIPERYEKWLIAAKPCVECGEICAMAGDRGKDMLRGAILRLAPYFIRCKPIWD